MRIHTLPEDSQQHRRYKHGHDARYSNRKTAHGSLNFANFHCLRCAESMACGTDRNALRHWILDTEKAAYAKKGQELVTKYIMNDEILEGVIPVNYEKIDK